MIQPRSSRILPVLRPTSLRANLPTGKNFSGSSLSIIHSDKLLLSILTDSISTPNPAPESIEPQLPLMIEVGKILVITIWLWCLIGANFCLNSLSTIVSDCLQDI